MGRIRSAFAPTAMPPKQLKLNPQQISDLISEPKQVLAIPGIGKGMLANLQEMLKRGKAHICTRRCWRSIGHPCWNLLKIQGLGPKTIALIWSAYKIM